VLVTATAIDANASEVKANQAVFQIERTGSKSKTLWVTIALGGTAANGTDYKPVSTAVKIKAGSRTAKVKITPKSDSLTEGPETVVCTVVDGAGYQAGSPANCTAMIADAAPAAPAGVTVVASDSSASESGGTGTFTVTRGGSTAAALTVRYSISGTATPGTDYQWLSGAWQNTSGTVTIPVGASTTTINVLPYADGLAESSETIIVTITPDASYPVGSPSSATVYLSNN
jgi:hypothetical protein